MTIKQKTSLFFAPAILVATFLGMDAISETAQSSASRSIINISFVVVAFGVSSGVLASALLLTRTFSLDPTLPEYPLWLKITSFYAAFMAVWSASFLFFSGDTPEDRAVRWQLEQVSNPFLVHILMVAIGLVYIGVLWFFPFKDEDVIRA